jgi:L-fuculose-phosphate aldolase
MNLWQAKQDIVRIGRWCYEAGFVAASDGNMSVRIRDMVVTTPTGMCKGYLAADDIVVVDLDGKKIEGKRDASSELAMHLEVYRQRDDIAACVHGHPPIATGFAVARIPLAQCVLPEVVLTLGSVPLAEYATPGTDEVPESIRPALPDHDTFLLANHGVLAVAGDIESAFFKLQKVEQFARIMLTARQLGRVSTLDSGDIRKLMDLKPGFFPDKPPCDTCGGCGEAGEACDAPVAADDNLVGKIADKVMERLG